MTEYLFDRFPNGTYETFEYDEGTGNITIRRYMDVQPTLDANKSAHLDGDGKTGDMWLAARIPEVVAQDWLTTKGVNAWKKDHWPEVRKLLNDPDWSRLRPHTFKL